jgi:hypothetical protein
VKSKLVIVPSSTGHAAANNEHDRVHSPFLRGDTEKVQIVVDQADELYREIRVENVVSDEEGEARLKPGADVDVVIEADPGATAKEDD